MPEYNIQDNSNLVNWRYDSYPLVEAGGTFGNVVWDPYNSLWRLFYHADADSGTGTIRQKTSTNGRVFQNDSLALSYGGVGSPDEKSTGVPFVWYETGEARPWRMIYRGTRLSDGLAVLMLATAVDATTPVWERKDTAGNVLTDAVLAGTSLAWDSGSIDFGGVLKSGNTYYIYYNTITVASRRIGLATSTDLVTWTKHASNPFFTGVTDYDDKDYDGTADLTAGFFCGDIVYWPLSDGTSRYVMFIPHYATGSVTAAFDVYTSTSPVFLKANRTYVGKLFNTATGGYVLQGYAINNCDTPRIITDDITRNVTTSSITGNDILMFSAINAVTGGWNQAYLIHHRTLNGAILSNVNADLPVSSPVHSLSSVGSDSNVKFLLLPGLTGTLRDLSGNNNHFELGNTSVRKGPQIINSSGIKFVAASSEIISWKGTGTISVLNAITGDFTVQARVSFASDFTSGSRGIVGYGTNGVPHHFFMYVTGAAGPTYTLNLAITSGGGTKNAAVALGAITLDQLYRLAVTKTGGKIYFFKDGTLLNAGGSAFDWTIDDTPTAQFYIGASDSGSSNYWDGYIDEVAISDVARWTATYVPSALSFSYQTSGYLFLPVFNFGATNAFPGLVNPLSTSLPTETAITTKVRTATNATDQSSTPGDFSNSPTPAVAGQYQQFALNFTGDGTLTSSIDDLQILVGAMRWGASNQHGTPDTGVNRFGVFGY